MPWEIKENDGKYCVHKKGEANPLHCYPSRGEAEKYLQALYANSGEYRGFYVMDNFVATKSGEPYRLLPFGVIVRGGQKHDINPETAKLFKLPFWKPPIKLGSHREDAPAGGHIVGLEVREDGIYAIPEYVPNGEKAMLDGAYRYHSPEIIWDDKGIEDISTGQIVPGPFIVGDALVHDPALGEKAALYTYETKNTEGGNTMAEEVKTVIPANVLEKIVSFFSKHEKIEDIPTKEQLQALEQERDTFKAKVEQNEAEKKVAVLKDTLTVKLKEDQFKSIPQDGVDMLLGMTEPQREWTLKTIAAYAAQVKASNIEREIGSGGDGLEEGSPEKLNVAILAYSKEHKVDYPTAMRELIQAQPDLFAAKR